MKKRILVVCSVCLLASLSAFSQEQTTTKHPIPQTVYAIPALKLQAEKIQAKEMQLDQAITSSRLQYKQIQEELNALNKEYAALLNKEIALCPHDGQRLELENELKYVEQQLTAANHR